MPYQVVQFRLAAPGWPDSPSSPREARLREGTRTFRDQNRYHFRWLVVGVGGLIVFGVALHGSRRRFIRQHPHPPAVK
jgi:hypothetical protein